MTSLLEPKQHRTPPRPRRSSQASDLDIGPAMTPRERQFSAVIDFARSEFELAAAAHDFERLDIWDGVLDGLETIAFWAKPAV